MMVVAVMVYRVENVTTSLYIEYINIVLICNYIYTDYFL